MTLLQSIVPSVMTLSLRTSSYTRVTTLVTTTLAVQAHRRQKPRPKLNAGLENQILHQTPSCWVSNYKLYGLIVKIVFRLCKSRWFFLWVIAAQQRVPLLLTLMAGSSLTSSSVDNEGKGSIKSLLSHKGVFLVFVKIKISAISAGHKFKRK